MIWKILQKAFYWFAVVLACVMLIKVLFDGYMMSMRGLSITGCYVLLCMGLDGLKELRA